MTEIDDDAYQEVLDGTAAEIEDLLIDVVKYKLSGKMTPELENRLESVGAVEISTVETVRRGPDGSKAPNFVYISIEVDDVSLLWMAKHRAENHSISPDDVDLWDLLGQLGKVSYWTEDGDDGRTYVTLGLRVYGENRIISNDGVVVWMEA